MDRDYPVDGAEEAEGISILDLINKAAAEEKRKIKAGLSFVASTSRSLENVNATVDKTTGRKEDTSDTAATNKTSYVENGTVTSNEAAAPPAQDNLSIRQEKLAQSSSSGQQETAWTTRPARPNPYADERRRSTVKSGQKVPLSTTIPAKRKSSEAENRQQPKSIVIDSEPKVPDLADREIYRQPPWYLPLAQMPKNFNEEQHKEFLQLRSIITKNERFPSKQNFYHDHIRRHLHKLEHTSPRADEVQRSKLMEAAEGLPRLFADRKPMSANHEHNGEYPWDIRGDAKMLYKKWLRQDFNSELLRGVITEHKRGKDSKYRWVSRLDANFPNRMRADYVGEGDLANGVVNGQWFPNQLCAIRDGAHGSAQAGIYGSAKGLGAYSIIVSTGNHADGQYEDIDEGTTLYYCGTQSKLGEAEPTEGTKHLHRNLTTGNLVRVLRTSKMPNKTYAPKRGIRYDGLYKVIGEELLNNDKKHYRFHMVRDPDHNTDPIRYQGVEQRPSPLDIERFDHVQALRQDNVELE